MWRTARTQFQKEGDKWRQLARAGESKGCWQNLVLAGLTVRVQSRTEGGSSQLPQRPPLLGLPVTHIHTPEHFENKRAPAYPCRWDLWVWAASAVLRQCRGPLVTPGDQRGAPLPRLSDGHVWGGKEGEPSEHPVTHPLAQLRGPGPPADSDLMGASMVLRPKQEARRTGSGWGVDKEGGTALLGCPVTGSACAEGGSG